MEAPGVNVKVLKRVNEMICEWRALYTFECGVRLGDGRSRMKLRQDFVTKS
jgi:hypothetical protein